jgi:hypothetical protein
LIYSGPLEDLAKRLDEQFAKAEAGLRRGLTEAIRFGEMLLTAKQRIGHGEWLSWVQRNCRFSTRTAQQYARLAKRQVELEAKSKAQLPAHLSLEGALDLLRKARCERTDEKDDRLSFEHAEKLVRRQGGLKLREMVNTGTVSAQEAAIVIEHVDWKVREQLEEQGPAAVQEKAKQLQEHPPPPSERELASQKRRAADEAQHDFLAPLEAAAKALTGAAQSVRLLGAAALTKHWRGFSFAPVVALFERIEKEAGFLAQQFRTLPDRKSPQ